MDNSKVKTKANGNTAKNTPLMTFIKVMFGVFIILVFSYFFYSQIFLTADSPSSGDYKYEEYKGEWTYVREDGTKESLTFPGKVDAKRGEKVILETVLPKDITGNKYLCFRSSKQDMRIWIDGELRESYNTKATRIFGTTSAVAYIFIELLPSDAGKILTMETVTDSSYTGIFYSAYYGDRMSIWYRFVPRYMPELMVAFLELVLSIVIILVSNILRIRFNRKIELAYLGWSVFLGACWSIFNSEFRQLLFPNLSSVSDMAFFMIMLIPFPFLIYMNEVQEGRYRSPYIVAGLFVVVDFIVCSTLHITHTIDFADTIIAMAGVCFLVIFMIAVTVVIDLVKKRVRSYWMVVAGILGAFFAAGIQIVKYFIKSSQFSGTVMALGLIFLLLMATIDTVYKILHMENEKQKAVMESEAKARFLANMSHEIRTPINAILGMDEMILRESGETATKQYALDIKRAGDNLLSLINDVLDMSKIEAGKLEIIPVDYDFSSLIHDIVSMMSIKANDKGLALKVLIDKNIPSRMYGDEIRIRQILINLLNNAVKYTETGTVTLKAEGITDDGMERLRFTVSDTGIGIKEEDISKLFSEYERIEEERNRNIEGTGLGMNITITLLSMMGSKLKVESAYGEGSTFSFELLQRITNDEPVGDIEDRIRKQSHEYTYEVSFEAPDARLLVVDDNAINRRVLSGLLRETKINVDEAESGEECLERISQNHYDIIFLDHMMPGMDGVETLKRMKDTENNRCKETPVVALTANAVSGSREMYIQEGFDEYLSKPIVPEKLEKLIAGILPKRLIKISDKVKEPLPDKAADEINYRKDIDGLPQIEGIDWEYALSHMPDARLLRETVTSFYISMDKEAEYLRSCYEKLLSFYGNELDFNSRDKLIDMDELIEDIEKESEKEDDNKKAMKDALSLYRTKVHAMKSSAAMIGAVELSHQAKLLEYAARDGRVFRVLSVTPSFINEWNSYKEKLVSFAPSESNEKKAYEYEEIIAYLNMLKNAMNDMDLDSADEMMEALLQYEYPDEPAKDIEELKIAVEAIDEELCSEITERLLEKLPK
ncbi:MAG: response regulator [Lachnospiraceae bacterium]|nr:response regulator [Lachnospiraceae bacterium]